MGLVREQLAKTGQEDVPAAITRECLARDTAIVGGVGVDLAVPSLVISDAAHPQVAVGILDLVVGGARRVAA